MESFFKNLEEFGEFLFTPMKLQDKRFLAKWMMISGLTLIAMYGVGGLTFGTGFALYLFGK